MASKKTTREWSEAEIEDLVIRLMRENMDVDTTVRQKAAQIVVEKRKQILRDFNGLTLEGPVEYRTHNGMVEVVIRDPTGDTDLAQFIKAHFLPMQKVKLLIMTN